jgi:hypothetical protein
MDRSDLDDLRIEQATEAASRDTPENRTSRDLLAGIAEVHQSLSVLDDLDDLPDGACGAVDRAGREIDGLMRSAVAFDRARGATWDDIGARLHVSKQAAWERFGP